MKAQSRYKPNSKYNGRKERNGFICGSATRHVYFFCVAVKIDGDRIQVRDTKDISDTTLTYTRSEWKAFIESVKKGEFDV